MDCQVCTEPFKGRRKRVTCYCGFVACVTCYETYILGNNTYARCMAPEKKCSKLWDRDFILANFTKAFEKKYAEHCAKIIFENEKLQLPATQLIVEKQILMEEIGKKIEILQMEINFLKEERWQIYHSNSTEKTERNTFTKKCTFEDCRGYLSSQYKCKLCTAKYCPDCFEIIKKGISDDSKEESEVSEHVCKKEDAESVALIKKDCKMCPDCNTYIFKTEGCNQMFCTVCKIGFDWKTLKKITGAFHNPHHAEWIATSGAIRSRGDIPCGGIPETLDIINNINMEKEYRKFFITYFAYVREVNDITVNRLAHPFDQKSNEDLRIKFLKKEIDEEKFLDNIRRREKKKSVEIELSQVYETFTSASIDIYLSSSNEKKSEIYKLVDYINNCFQKIGNKYSVKERKIEYRF